MFMYPASSADCRFTVYSCLFMCFWTRVKRLLLVITEGMCFLARHSISNIFESAGLEERRISSVPMARLGSYSPGFLRLSALI